LINKKLVDYVAMDIKAPIDSQVYKNILGEGINLEDIKKSVEILKNSKIESEFRTTVIPDIHTEKDFLEIAKWIGGPNIKYYLQNFRPEKTIDPEFEKIKPYPDNFLEKVKKEIKSFFKECGIR
ncbi:MAG: anaerobic ribonucleoside-triphosphate reductase activating protein, partial [bacterium]|nr:anaerobic ribonucleoside-triphosphate reductase activating protein [bacterium]